MDEEKVVNFETEPVEPIKKKKITGQVILFVFETIFAGLSALFLSVFLNAVRDAQQADPEAAVFALFFTFILFIIPYLVADVIAFILAAVGFGRSFSNFKTDKKGWGIALLIFSAIYLIFAIGSMLYLFIWF